MREIKFRAWDGKNMLSGASLLHWIFGVHNSKELLVLEKATFLQFTGLKDKNGKEIYESDILKDFEGDLLNVYIEGLRYVGAHTPGRGWVPMYHAFNEQCEVVGNIYENPNLLP